MRFLSKLILALSGIAGILVGLALLLSGASFFLLGNPDIATQVRDAIEQAYDGMDPNLVNMYREYVEMIMTNYMAFGIGFCVAGILFFIGASIAFKANKKGRFVALFIFAVLNVNPGYLLGGLFGLLGKKDE